MDRIERFPWNKLRGWFQQGVSRGRFLKMLGIGAGAMWLSGRFKRPAWAKAGTTLKPRVARAVKTECDLAVVRGSDPAAATRRAVETLGGIERFVRRGDLVVVKPNIGWDRRPEHAANTDPAVVAALVRLCREAGARAVRVFDHTCNDARRTYANSGIADAVRQAGGLVSFVSDWKFYPGQFAPGSGMADWPIYRDAVECDVFINVPVAKHHGLTRVSLSIKNLMGVCGGMRGIMHQGIDRKLADLAAFIRPDLTVIDATRILLRHGPTGGRLEDVEKKDLIIAGTDPVLADAYATTLFGLKPGEIGHLRAAAEAKLGSMDFQSAKILEVQA